MNKIQGFRPGYNYNNLNFTAFRRQKKDDPDKLIFLDKHLLDYGVPEKVAFVRDHEYEFHTVMLFDKNNECFYSEKIPDNEVSDTRTLFRQNGVEDFVYLEDIKGGQYGQAKKICKKGKNTIEFNQLSPKDRAVIMKALYDLHKKETAAKTYLKGPAVLSHPEYGHTMGYYSFLAETYDSDFDIDSVLENLNISTKGHFLPEKIDKISVSDDGKLMRIETKKGVRASLNFNNGRRTVFEDENITIMDNNGPVINKHQFLSQEESM